MIYGISSYHRPQCKTFFALKELGANEEDIIICVNDEDDFTEYKKTFKNVIYVKGDCVAQNRNNLLRIAKGNIVLLDDDIRYFNKLVAAKTKSGVSWRKIESIIELEKMIEECFTEMKRIGANVFGTYSIGNADWAKATILKDGVFSINKLFQGGFCGFTGLEKYDENFKVLDDYELILRLISQGKFSIRRNDLIAEKNGMGKDEGGYFNLYKQGIQQLYGRRLCAKYPKLVTANENYTRFRLKSKHVIGY